MRFPAEPRDVVQEPGTSLARRAQRNALFRRTSTDFDESLTVNRHFRFTDDVTSSSYYYRPVNSSPVTKVALLVLYISYADHGNYEKFYKSNLV